MTNSGGCTCFSMLVGMVFLVLGHFLNFFLSVLGAMVIISGVGIYLYNRHECSKSKRQKSDKSFNVAENVQ